MEEYTAESIRLISPIEHIRSKPKMYLGDKPINGETLSSSLRFDIEHLLDTTGIVVRCEDWWMVVCEADWLAGDPEIPIDRYFKRPVPYEGKVNSHHSEILIAAFAADIVTATPNERQLIQGTVSETDTLWDCIDSLPQWKRLVAFRLN